MEGTCAHTCLNVFVERHFLGCLLRLEPQPFLWWQVWRLACVNISRTALDESKAHIRSLIAPAETVMDFTIGAPLWFAARVRARVTSPLPFRFVVAAGGRWLLAQCLFYLSRGSKAAASPHLHLSLISCCCVPQAGGSTASVLLSGLGADEQLAGYARHRTRHRKAGWAALQQELALDFNRLWKRNLGRDDRVLAGSPMWMPVV